ncbi:cysteine dioxygenase [Marininema halotolerans]|uniref:Cysteine dioxygenase n=1 Tax=Marininema halotolerans TaxID=1155944 RepID=A0A1I6QIC5_9BACL|nr:cysteine dioxygenase family protein [Marininema halotolerans]SFS52233.1 cysteine dioxygenase [Marininema halotolerans]
MSFLSKLQHAFDCLNDPTARELKDVLDHLQVEEEELRQFLEEPGLFPYGRKLLYQSEHVEVLLMNWAKQFKCAPHDHGDSHGWVHVVKGESTQTVYSLEKEVPIPKHTGISAEGTSFFAPRTMVHDMENCSESALITLHVYSPPISGMKVYDLERCMSCIVSKDCGAWWPEEQRQRLKEMKLGEVVPR